MFDIFLAEDVRKLAKNKSIVFMGDSNVRAMYKDFLCLLRESRFISQNILKKKMENNVFGDELVYHGQRTNGRSYREERQALINSTSVSFYFLTKVYDEYVEEVLDQITRRSQPDVIIINSCVWDITRWGCDGVYHYKDNLRFLMRKFRRLIPDCLIIWVTTPPLAAEMKGGFLVKELQFLKYSLRFHVVEANHFAKKVVVENGFDVLDVHFHLQMQIHRRSHDGIHWEPKAVRYITNLILRHISLSWNVPLPHRYESALEDENLIRFGDAEKSKSRKKEIKKIVFNEKPVHSETSSISKDSGKLQSIVTVVDDQENTKRKRKRRSSIQLYKVPKWKESIYKNISEAEKKARKKRIRQWKQALIDSPISSAPSFEPNFHAKNSTYDSQDQIPALKPEPLNNSFPSDQTNFNPATSSIYLLPTPAHNSDKSYHVNSPNLSETSLPPYSPGHQQPYNDHSPSGEFQQQPTFKRSKDFDFPIITSPSQIPLPPYSPGHPPSTDNPLRTNESPLLQFNRSVHFDTPATSSSQAPCSSYSPYHNQFDNAASQRHVIDCQTGWSASGFTNMGNREYFSSQSAVLNRRSLQHNRMVQAVDNTPVPYKFPNVTSGQNLQPRYQFVNDEIPQIYHF